jgi:chromosome segregation ATPase
MTSNNGNGGDHPELGLDEAVPTPRSAQSREAQPVDRIGLIESRLDAIEALQSVIARRQANGFATVSSDHREMREQIDQVHQQGEDLHVQMMLLTADVELWHKSRRALEEGQAAIVKAIEALTRKVDALAASDAEHARGIDEARQSYSDESKELRAFGEANRRAIVTAELEDKRKRTDAELAHRKARNAQIRQVAGVLVLLSLTALTAYLKGSGWLP